MIYLQLFLEFFKTGLFAVGGGQATIPFLYNMSTKTGWFTASQLADMIAISESTPGPIGVNMATYVGYSVKGLLGSVSSTLGLVAPSVIIITLISMFLMTFDKKPVVQTVFKYLKAAALGLIAYALINVAAVALFSESVIVVKNVVFCVILFVLARIFRKVHPVFFIMAGAVFGILFI